MVHSMFRLFQCLKCSPTIELVFNMISFCFTASRPPRFLLAVCVRVQELLMEVYRCIGEPDSLYGCGGEKMSSPLTR